MNETLTKLNRVYEPLTNESWLKVLQTPVSKRASFLPDENQKLLTIGQVVARFLGVPADEEDYYQRIYDYVHGENYKLRLLSAEILDKSSEENKEDMELLVPLIKQELEKSAIKQKLTAFNSEIFLIPFRSSLLTNQVFIAFQEVLNRIQKEIDGGIMNPEIPALLAELIQWSRKFLKEFYGINPLEDMPKFLWYGNFQKKHARFVHFLVGLGCDIVVFSPDGEDILSGFDEADLIFVRRFRYLKNARPFPKEKSRRKSTPAYRAAKEIEDLLSGGGTVLYKEWQLRDYTPQSLTLKTTYDELFILLKETAMIRPGFEARNGIVKIPSLFAKIQGISRNRREYWNRMHSLILTENTLFIKQFPFSRNIDNDLRFHYRQSLDRDGMLNPEKLLHSRFWKYKRLPTSLQKGIAFAIRNICGNPALKPVYRESVNDLRVYLFTQVLQLPGEILKLLQNFDYSREVPKVVLFNNGLNGVLTRADACALLLLNHIGVDIVIYNPSGLNDIENYIYEDLFDVHWLEEVVDEQEYKEPSFLKKLYYQGLFHLKKRSLRP